MRAVVGDDDKPVEAAARLLHARHAALHRGGRRDPQGQARHRARQEAAGGERLCGPAGHLPGGAGPADRQGQGEVTADLLKQIGMNVDFVATDWGTVGQRRATKNAAGPGRLEHVPHLACRRRLRQSGGLHRDPRQRRQGLVRLARRARRSRPRSTAWFEAKTSTRRRRRSRRLNKAAIENVVYVPTGFFLRLSGLAQQRLAASSRARCRSSGASAKTRMTASVSSAPCSPTSSGASWRPSRSWRSSRCSCSACSTSRPATRRR